MLFSLHLNRKVNFKNARFSTCSHAQDPGTQPLTLKPCIVLLPSRAYSCQDVPQGEIAIACTSWLAIHSKLSLKALSMLPVPLVGSLWHSSACLPSQDAPCRCSPAKCLTTHTHATVRHPRPALARRWRSTGAGATHGRRGGLWGPHGFWTQPEGWRSAWRRGAALLLMYFHAAHGLIELTE